MYNKIAVIGISVKLPGAETLDSFHRNLIRRKNSMRELSEERKKLLGYDDEVSYYLAEIKGIDEFDNEYFGISNREAKAMFPEMRLSMEQAVKAIWDAGYTARELRGSNCGVIVTQSPGNYKKFLPERDAFSFVGNQGAMTAGHIAYHLDLRGPNMQLASTCSSSLMSVHEACKMLSLEEADLMLVGGAQLSMPDTEDLGEMHSLGIVSENAECIPFSDKASGTQCGEAAAFILLKRYEDAVRDKDRIYAVIRSAAVNSNGARSGNLTAPDSDAEADVIKKAWKCAGVSATDITEIETHGTATKIGDPIETAGILRALDGTSHEPPIYLGAVKSNIGHTISMAGMTSLIKVITGFENDVCYPICGLDECDSAIRDKVLKPLSEPIFYGHDEKRIAGVSAYGFSGNNVHAVIENVPGSTDISREPDNFNRLLKLSARTPEAAEAYIEALCRELSSPETDVNSFVYTLNTGRDDFQYRAVIQFSDTRELSQRLEAVRLSKIQPEARYEIHIGAHKESSMDIDMRVQAYITSHFKDIPESCRILTTDAAVLGVLKNLGINAEIICCDKYGELVKKLYETPEKIAEITKEYEALTDVSSDKGFYVANEEKTIADLTQQGAFESCLTEIYLHGANINWRKYYPQAYEKLHLPCDVFSRKKLWGDACPQNKTKQTVSAETASSEDIVICSCYNKAEPEKTVDIVCENSSEEKDIRTVILELWETALGSSEISSEDSFFELGGNSLTAMMIIDKLNASMNCDLTVDDLYMYDSVDSLAEYIEGELL